MNEKILTQLQVLYDDTVAHATLQQIQNRIDQQIKKFQTKSPFSFSEQDVVLITYGDTVCSSDTRPLQSLHQFSQAYLKEAISAIHILPFYPYSSDDGFSVKDYYAVDPQLGTWDDVEQIGADFTLMFDAVLNHMSAQSEWFKAFLADDPEFVGMFRTESPEADLSSVTRPRATSLLTPFTKSNGEAVHVWTTFSVDQVDLDVRHPETLLKLLDILYFYVTKGASIIRLDAIAYLWKEVGTSSIHLPQTHAIIKLMRAYLDEVAPHVILITETNVPHQENVSYFGDGFDEAQMVYNFTLPPLLFHTLLSGNATKLTRWVNTLASPSNRCTFFNFTASHDGIGVRPVEGMLDDTELGQLIAHTEARGGRVSYKQNSDGSQSPYELNITYIDAVTDANQPIELQIKRFLLSQAIALSLAGVPAIYIHSLLGSHNDIEGMKRTGLARTINRAKLQLDTLTAELHNSDNFRSRIFDKYLKLIDMRTKQTAFHPNATQKAIDTGSPGLLALLRTAVDKSQRILAIYNVTDTTQSYSIESFTGDGGIDLITGTSLSRTVELAPYDFYWIHL